MRKGLVAVGLLSALVVAELVFFGPGKAGGQAIEREERQLALERERSRLTLEREKSQLAQMYIEAEMNRLAARFSGVVDIYLGNSEQAAITGVRFADLVDLGGKKTYKFEKRGEFWLIDPARIGMVHVVLPNSQGVSTAAPSLHADSAVPAPAPFVGSVPDKPKSEDKKR